MIEDLIKKYDPSLIHQIYDSWPEIAKESYESRADFIDFKGIDSIVFAGMGGSGTLGDVFSSLLSKINLHVYVVKGYVLPSTVDENTLVVATSVSGETMETLSILESAKKLPCKIIAFSSGGRLQEYCSKNGIEYRFIEKLHSPRTSFARYLYAMLKILQPAIPIEKHDINESLAELRNLKKSISSSNLTNTNISMNLAESISGIPVIYYPAGLRAAAIRFKNSLNENAKCHAMVEDVIESGHNNIVSWERSSNVNPILLEGHDDHIHTKERWQIMKDYFAKNGIDYQEVRSPAGSILTKLISMIYMLDYSSIYLALLSKIDPSPTKSIDFIKERLEL